MPHKASRMLSEGTWRLAPSNSGRVGCMLHVVHESDASARTAYDGSPCQLLMQRVCCLRVAAAAGMQFFTCWHSSRRNERRFHLATCWAFGVVCLALLPLTEIKGAHSASFLLLILGVVGVFGVEGVSVSYYLALMGGEKGVGIAIINMLGALGGFAGP